MFERRKSFGRAIVIAFVALGMSTLLAACDEGPLEEAGESIDEGIEEVEDEVDDAIDG